MYFCKNCGEPYMTDEAVMCVKCGVAKGQGNNYCHNCGKPLAPDAAVCLNCGVANKQAPAPDAKSKLVAGLLAIFLGTFLPVRIMIPSTSPQIPTPITMNTPTTTQHKRIPTMESTNWVTALPV